MKTLDDASGRLRRFVAESPPRSASKVNSLVPLQGAEISVDHPCGSELPHGGSRMGRADGPDFCELNFL